VNDGLHRLVEVMHALRQGCPWDREQTHLTLAAYLVEETAETLEAIESGDDAHLAEELGDLLLQVVFHAEIAAERGAFDIDAIAHGIAEKLVRRHPYVFGDGEVPSDLMGSWEARKRAEKRRTSALDGIAEPLSSLARAHKVVSRARHHGVPVELPEVPVTEAEVGAEVLALVARAQAAGVDPDQAVRLAVRRLEAEVRGAESAENAATRVRTGAAGAG